MKKLLIVFATMALFNQACNTPKTAAPFQDHYNVAWSTQSKNSSESMPVVGGDIACNVWVEGGELLFYISRSGSFDEHGTYLKSGRVRVKLTPNPFDGAGSFRQELMLQDGFVEIEGKAGNNTLNAKIRLWVEIQRPVIHVDVHANRPIEVEAVYESWRTEDRKLAHGN